MRVAVDRVARQARRSRRARCTRFAASRPVAMPCTRSGSVSIEPIVMRGFSDAYGSWKIICIRRRMRRSSSPPRRVTSVPSKMIVPAVASTSRITARAKVDLPQPDSPTRPSVSPRRTSSDTPSTARTVADPPLDDEALGDREVDLEALGAQQRLRRPVGGGGRRRGSGDAASSTPAPLEAGGHEPLALRGVPARHLVAVGSVRRLLERWILDAAALLHVEAARRERAARDLPRQVGRLALDRHQLAAALARRGAGSTAAGRPCTGGAAARRAPSVSARSTMCPAYMTLIVARHAGHHARGRG